MKTEKRKPTPRSTHPPRYMTSRIASSPPEGQRSLFWRFDNWLQGPKRRLEQSALAHFAVIAAGAFTLYQLAVDLIDRGDERQERRQAQVERAWDQLFTQAVGNTGKGNALNILMRNGEQIGRLDLSCQTIGKSDCLDPPIFSNVDFRLRKIDSNVNESEVEFPNFKDVAFEHSNFFDVYFGDEFTGVQIYNSNMHNTIITSEHIDIESSDTSEANIAPDLFKRIKRSNISNVALDRDKGDVRKYEIELRENWFWSDKPPYPFRASTLKPDDTVFILSIETTLCDARFRSEDSTTTDLFGWTTSVGYDELAGETKPRLVQNLNLPDSNFLVKEGRTYLKSKDIVGAYTEIEGDECPLISLKDARKMYPRAYRHAQYIDPSAERQPVSPQMRR